MIVLPVDGSRWIGFGREDESSAISSIRLNLTKLNEPAIEIHTTGTKSKLNLDLIERIYLLVYGTGLFFLGLFDWIGGDEVNAAILMESGRECFQGFLSGKIAYRESNLSGKLFSDPEFPSIPFPSPYSFRLVRECSVDDLAEAAQQQTGKLLKEAKNLWGRLFR